MDSPKMVDPPIPAYSDHNGILICTRCFRNILRDESFCLKCNILEYYDSTNKSSDPASQ